MRTAGLMMNDVWADRVLRERGVEAHRYDGLQAEIGVLVDSVELKHRGKEENHRPYLHVIGELRSVTPAEPLPYGITQVTYSPSQGEKVDAYYEFDEQQLLALAGKGYFTSAFAVPETLTGIEWELPATVDALVLTPSAQQHDAPVVFMNVHRIADLEIDLETSGYDLSEYFPDHSKDGLVQAEGPTDERALRARSDAMNSLFSEEELDLLEQTAPQERVEQQEQPAAERVDTELQQVEAQIAAEREQFQSQLVRTEGTTEQLYHKHVSQVLQPIAPEQPARDAGADLDFGLEEEQKAAPTLEQRKREAAARAADLDFGEDGEHDLGS